MTRRTRDLPERRRGELRRDVGSQRLSGDRCSTTLERLASGRQTDQGRPVRFERPPATRKSRDGTTSRAWRCRIPNVSCKARLHSTESQAEPIGDLYPGGVLGGKLRTDIGRLERRG